MCSARGLSSPHAVWDYHLGSPTIGTIGNAALVAGGGCSTGSTCTETASQSYTPAAILAAGAYTITAAYLSTNENYATGSGTTSLTVNKQTPAVSVTPPKLLPPFKVSVPLPVLVTW